MPHAVVAAAYGGPEVIEVVEVPSREPGPGEVVIEVRAAALNPVDLKVASGARGGGDPSRLPLRLGNEAAGVITAVGDGATGADGTVFAVGDEVIGYRLAGALADELTVPAKDVLRKPPSLSFEEGAGLLLVAVTAYHGLEAIEAEAGETLLLHGAAGSVGRIAIQLAVRRGIRVIGTAAEHRHDELRALGAEPVVYGPGLADRVRALAPTVDAAFDAIGSAEALAVSLELVADRSRIVTIVDAPAFLAAGAKAIGGGPGADPGTELRNAARAPLVALAGEGGLTLPVTATYPIGQARAAYEQLAAGHAGGKIVLVP